MADSADQYFCGSFLGLVCDFGYVIISSGTGFVRLVCVLLFVNSDLLFGYNWVIGIVKLLF